MLRRRWSLHDVADVEAFISRAVAREYGSLADHEREDLIAYLLAEAWRASERFDAGSGRRFGPLLAAVVRRRTVDWLRLRRGRTRWTFGTTEQIRRHTPGYAGRTIERRRPELVSLDDDRAGG